MLRPEALAALADCEQIIHAGDLGKPEVLARLARLAPTVAVRGNVDRGAWAEAVPETQTLLIRDELVYVLHNLQDLGFEPVEQDVDIVISGHSHQAVLREEAGVIYLNPGSAGPRRFSLPVTLARMYIGPNALRVELVDVMSGATLQTLAVSRRPGSA